MAIQIGFETLIEDQPGPRWQALFARLWPGYRAWFLRSGAVARPSYLESRRALRQHMPELVPTWQRLVELAGGGDVEARFLSLWCPPPYIVGCSQAVWIDPAGAEEPALLRNYDFAPALLEGSWLATRWQGQRVAAMGDCIWGALDGQNEAGVAASLSFGGSTVSGTGFGIPLVLRYVLEMAQSTAEAVALLQRVPVSMPYSITVLDRRAEWATVFVGPDRPAEVTRRKAVTNFQHHIEWPEHARATHAAERLERLQRQVDGPGTLEDAIGALLQPPLYQSAYLRGYGTLYGVAYRPASGRMELLWPGVRWPQTLDAFAEGRRDIVYTPGAEAPPDPDETALAQLLTESRS
ncbi:C45 family peptidase [Variovorax soli]|uniref:Choloylglycine hydrolase n=1 Tax=Variovorax soli TaxID=376815 RepID=A0ABU1NII6_9BURK|nr:C45 family peptidase [Variovorax soli]MDR6538272.1 putative choloylglycine hydrolase [Variovorax soli]